MKAPTINDLYLTRDALKSIIVHTSAGPELDSLKKELEEVNAKIAKWEEAYPATPVLD